MFVLHYADDSTPVEGDAVNHMSTARRLATEAALHTGRAIQIGTLGEDGSVKPRIVIRPDGGAEPPKGSKQPQGSVGCSAGEDKPPCFCPNCRAARRAR